MLYLSINFNKKKYWFLEVILQIFVVILFYIMGDGFYWLFFICVYFFYIYVYEVMNMVIFLFKYRVEKFLLRMFDLI